MKECDLVSENVPEVVEIKAETYRVLDAHARPAMLGPC